MWIYAQKTGALYRSLNGELTYLTKGYSGRGQYENDPDAQCTKDYGPLPRGLYVIGAPHTMNHMQNCLPLTPDSGNDMCAPARAGFWIHDGVSHGPHRATSHGCICVPMAARLTIWQSGDHRLQVVGPDPDLP